MATERRADIRAALHGLLSRSLPSDQAASLLETAPAVEQPVPAIIPMPPAPLPPPPAAGFKIAGGDLLLSDDQWMVLKGIRDELIGHGIAAETPHVIQAIIDVIMARPALCRKLMALYLLKG